MSTKIYNGWLLNMKLNKVLPWIRQIRPRFERERAKMIARSCPAIIGSDVAAHWKAHRVLSDLARHARTSPYNEPGDYSAVIVLLPTSKKLLCLSYWKVYDDVWTSIPEVSYYGYWDNSDPENGVTDAEWEQREKDWDAALPYEDAVPSYRGFTATILTHDIPLPADIKRSHEQD